MNGARSEQKQPSESLRDDAGTSPVSIATDGSGMLGRVLDPQTHVLLVEDDAEMRQLTGRLLRENGFVVTVARDGREMRALLAGPTLRVDLLLLDVMLPGPSGFELLRGVRTAWPDLPVIMLTAKGEETDRVLGLELGADDYVAKPFRPRELVARLRAVLRRTGSASHAGVPDGADTTATGRLLQFGGWTLDTGSRDLTSPRGALVDLSGAEYDLLLAFLAHPQRVLSRDQLLEIGRRRIGDPFDRAVDVQVSRLRRKIEPDEESTPLIKTVRGVGYMLVVPVARA